MTPVDVPPGAAGAPGAGTTGRAAPGGSGAVGSGAPSGAVPVPVPPNGEAPPTAPKGEWMGQKAVGSVPGMNDSM
jgi:hypothetical protein